MKAFLKIFAASVALALTASCSTTKTGSHTNNAWSTVRPDIESYNELTMALDPTGVTYTIDVSTAEGRLKLHKLSLPEAEQLALTEALMYYNCATLFNPQFTHLKKGKDILRVTVYGYPARYKHKQP